MMSHGRSASGVAGPILTRRVGGVGRHPSIETCASQNVVCVGRVTATVHHRALLSEAVVLGQFVVVAVQVINTGRDDDTLRVDPRSLADTIARADGLNIALRLLTQVSVPRLARHTGRFSEALTVTIGTGQSTKLGAVAAANTGNEKTHRLQRMVGGRRGRGR